MALPNTVLTDGAHEDHTKFWAAALGRITDDFHFRQPWLSYAPTSEDIVSEDCALAPETRALIEELGRGQDLGMLVVIVAAASHLLHTYTQAPVVTIDSPLMANGDGEDDGREFIPLATAADRGLSVRDYLKQVSEDIARSYSYQHFPIAQFSEVLLKRSRPRTNVFVSFAGLHAATASDQHDFQIAISNNPLRIRLTGRTPGFSRAYLHTFARHLGRVLEGFRDRSARLDDIDVMGADERNRLLVEYNAASAGATCASTIHELFQEQAARSGSHIAVRLHDTTISYDTLNKRANQLARTLQNDYGIQRGDVVGVVTHRSPLTIAGLLAILKAGAIYLPIDPEYPEERLQFMVADAGVKVLLVHAEHFDRLTSLYETPMFALDIQLETLDTPDANLEPITTTDDVAYIIYTSGSTGQPKAVLLEHRGFVAMVRHHIEAFGVQATDRLLQFYGQSFDSSLFEIFVALLSGGTLVMVDRDTINDPAQLSAYVDSQQITMLTLPPVYSSTLDRDRLATVRRYVSAGDHCRVEDALRLAQTADYYNSYGPTETSVCVTHYKVDPQGRYGSRIPIGKPITGTAIYLLDDQLKLVPEGVVGEICVGGVSVARGYLNRDDLTAQKFVPNPFAEGQRLYRTGDLGVWLPDGNLEVIGRKDNQVKIRGYRVELGEIESVLDQHPLVKESAVIAREDDLGNKRLAACVTATGSIDVEELKSLLRARLPEFMVPATFTVLAEMPLTANGKIDRKALAALIETTSTATPKSAPPETPVQETLAGIWQEVLGVAPVGIHDNLFDLGGDSILIIQIVARARECGLKLTPNQLFDHQTIAELANVAIAVQPAMPVAMEQDVIEGAAPLAPMQKWFFEQRFSDPHRFNQSVCLEVPADGIDIVAAEGATAAVLAHHDALRLRFVEHADGWSADYGPVPADVPFRVIDLTSVSADLVEQTVAEAVVACQTAFDLTTGPLLQVRLLQLGGGRASRLLFVAHHLVIDGVSWRILLGDFSTAYAQISRREPIDLPAKTTSFRTWAMRLNELAGTVDSHYWLATPTGTILPLPTDRPRMREANTVASERHVSRTLDAETTTALLQDVPRVYTTEINDILLAGLALTFQSWTGNNDLLIDLEAHGREELVDDVDTSRTVGWFTAQFPVSLHLDPHAAPGDAIKSVKEQLRAVPDRGAGFGVLRYLSDDSAVVDQLKQRPVPEILFNYFGQAGRVLAPDISWTLMPEGTFGDISPRAQRPHLLAINGMITDGRLTMTWTFSEALHDRQTIEDLATRYEQTLRLLVDHCRTTTTKQYTPSDFPAAGLDQKSLDALVAKLNR